MSIGIWQLLLIAVVVVLLFGSGKVSDLMGDVAKGIKNFRKGLQDNDDDEPPKVITSERHESQPQKTEQRE